MIRICKCKKENIKICDKCKDKRLFPYKDLHFYYNGKYIGQSYILRLIDKKGL